MMKNPLPKTRYITGPASLLKIFASYAIDLFIVNLVIISPFKKLFREMLPQQTSEIYSYLQNNPQANSMLIASSIFIGVLTVGYFAFFEYKVQQTPGKMIMKLFIVPEKGKKLSVWNYILSNLTFIPLFPFFFLWVIDPIHMFLSKKNQRFMEKIANISVMEKYPVLV